jgi:hypothetical protein
VILASLSLSFAVLSAHAAACEDGMFKGMYHGKQCHSADIPAVLARAWAAGVDRIIVRLPPPGVPLYPCLLLNCLGFFSNFFVWRDGRSPAGR